MHKVSGKFDLLCIGHCCYDKVEHGLILGGTCSYASLVGQQLGLQVGVITSVGSDFLFSKIFKDKDIPLKIIPADHTTLFENIYHGNQRSQYLRRRASTIAADHTNVASDYSIVLIGGIADEIDFSITTHFPRSLICATIQGSIRKWDESGLISPKEMIWADLSDVDIVILSRDDLRGLDDALSKIRKHVSHVVVTDGAQDVVIYKDGRTHIYPVYPVQEVEATGAGDVFATAYIVRYHQTGDVSEACIFAHCAASLIIAGIGLISLPTAEKISERVLMYKELFGVS